jgi:triacylglycerol lipase
MTQWLRASGYRTKRAGIRSNVACSEVACERLEERLESLAGRTGARVAIVGQGRDGVIAKALGARRPDLVSGVVALGSPVLSQLSIHPVVLAQVGVVAALGSGPVPGLISWRCLRGDCCARFREAVAGPLAPGVGYVAIYSRSDGIVDWRSCIDPYADECAEVSASHCGMGVNAGAYRVIARALAGFRDADERLPQAA